MSTHRRRRHNCINHPRSRAKVKCSKCGKWLCGECALLYKGNFYCAKTCRPSPVIPKNLPLITKPPEPNQRGLSVNSLITWSASTLALCAVVLCTWALRELYYSKKEIVSLQKNRQTLITNLKNRNSSIRALRTRLVSLEESVSWRQRTSESSLINQASVVPLPMYKPEHPKVSKPEESLSENGFPLTFNNGPTDRKLVSFTFDGGSDANAASDILDTLRSRNVKATMFVTGQFIRKFPDIVAEIAREGHEIGNHTLSHPHLTTWPQDHTHTLLPQINRDFLLHQLGGAEKLLYDKTGQHFAPLWRAPYGEFNKTVFKWALQRGYMHVGWRQGRTWSQGLDSNDWIPDDSIKGYKTPQEVMTKILALAETKPYGINGGIILMHLGTERAEKENQVHYIIGSLIDSLRIMGYRIVPVSEMMEQSGLDLALLSSKTHIPETSIANRIEKTNEP